MIQRLVVHFEETLGEDARTRIAQAVDEALRRECRYRSASAEAGGIVFLIECETGALVHGQESAA